MMEKGKRLMENKEGRKEWEREWWSDGIWSYKVTVLVSRANVYNKRKWLRVIKNIVEIKRKKLFNLTKHCKESKKEIKYKYI